MGGIQRAVDRPEAASPRLVVRCSGGPSAVLYRRGTISSESRAHMGRQSTGMTGINCSSGALIVGDLMREPGCQARNQQVKN